MKQPIMDKPIIAQLLYVLASEGDAAYQKKDNEFRKGILENIAQMTQDYWSEDQGYVLGIMEVYCATVRKLLSKTQLAIADKVVRTTILDATMISVNCNKGGHHES